MENQNIPVPVPVDENARLQTEIARLNEKIAKYEQQFILICFDMAKEDGLDLRILVAESSGENCVQVYVKALRAQRDQNKINPETIPLPFIQADTRFLRIGNATENFSCSCGSNLFTRYEKDGATKYRCTGCSATYHE